MNPTKKQIEWIETIAATFAGIQIEFSAYMAGGKLFFTLRPMVQHWLVIHAEIGRGGGFTGQQTNHGNRSVLEVTNKEYGLALLQLAAQECGQIGGAP